MAQKEPFCVMMWKIPIGCIFTWEFWGGNRGERETMLVRMNRMRIKVDTEGVQCSGQVPCESTTCHHLPP